MNRSKFRIRDRHLTEYVFVIIVIWVAGYSLGAIVNRTEPVFGLQPAVYGAVLGWTFGAIVAIICFSVVLNATGHLRTEANT